jgi:quercetin dioxygenase-like cupin family protein
VRRSTAAADDQNLPRPVAAMAEAFASGARTGLHSHERSRLLYAVSGLMAAETERGAWIVPSG